MEVNAWLQRIYAGEAQLSVYGISATTGEAGGVLSQFIKGYTSVSQIFNFEDPEYYSTVEKALGTINADERNQLFYKAQEILMKAHILIPVWHKEINAALQKNVKGFNLMPTFEQHYLQFVYFEE
jgi:ABC-type transport system substrate-binding protein